MPSLYVALEQDLGLDSPDFRELLEPWFETFSAKVEVNLMRFYGQDPAEFLDDDELEDIPTGSQWFAAEEGLKAIQTLITALETNNSKAAERARDELIDLRSLLEAVSAKNVRFHLGLDI